MNWMIVHSYGNRVEADMAVSLLAASGIEAIINGGDMGGTNPLYSYSFGVNVLVEESNVKEATTLLDEQAKNNRGSRPVPAPLTVRTRIFSFAMQFFWLCTAVSFVAMIAEPTVTNKMSGTFLILLLAVYGLSFMTTIAYVMSKRADESRHRQESVD